MFETLAESLLTGRLKPGGVEGVKGRSGDSWGDGVCEGVCGAVLEAEPSLLLFNVKICCLSVNDLGVFFFLLG